MKYIVLCFLFLGTLMASNNLKDETSPYLLQHKDNPVNWYPWGGKAFAKAKKEGKFVFLSIGYSTCHWCHVMAHESFEDDEVAKILNKDFISIKVDKEQYPHIDGYYQNIYRLMNKKGGGWPLTIVLTSDMKPFFSGTYIPKESGYGSAGLLNILNQVVTISKDKLVKSANTILQIVEQSKNNKNDVVVKIDKQIEQKVISQYKSYFDFKYKGFSKAPKFPQATNIQLLLKVYEVTKDKDAINMATSMLSAMAKGGIYDQIEGAFYRYSVDKRWAIPHFEKMLYTNAELLPAYTSAYKITNKKLYKNVVIQTIAQIDKRFQQDGVYQSASNADSENFDGHNEEGFYFVYDYVEAEEYLEKNNISQNDIKENLAYLGITKDGNFDGDFSNPSITSDIVPTNFEKIKELLVKLRENKKYPFIDNKINTAWNALYLKAKFQARIIDKKYILQAKNSLDKLLKLVYKNGILYHQTIKGVEATQEGLLEDYSFMAAALFEAYQSTLDKKYFKLFESIVQQSIERFYKDDVWMESADGFKTNASIDDSSYASALAVNIQNLILYATVEANTKIYDIAQKTIDQFSSKLNSYPVYYPSAVLALLQTKYEPVFIKSIQENLKTFDTNDIKYPFVYKYIYDSKQYLACKINSCFSYSDDFKKVKKDIEDL